MKSHRNYHSLLGGTSGSNDSSGFGTSVDGLLRSQSDDEMLDITTGTTDDLRNVPNRSHGNSNLLRNGGGNLVESERMDAAEEDYGMLAPMRILPEICNLRATLSGKYLANSFLEFIKCISLLSLVAFTSCFLVS